MLRLLLPLACLVALGAGAKSLCRSNRGENLIQFNNRNQDIHLPCDYWALKGQRCGRFSISLTPGNRWVYPKYQLDTLWLAVEDTTTGEFWEGRTTNKLAVKYYNSMGGRELWTKKGGDLETHQLLNFGSEKKDNKRRLYATDKDQTFRVTFIPWDPNNRKDHPNSDWEFECLVDDGELDRDYPTQMCGGEVKTEVKDQAKERFGLPDRFRANLIYFDIFTNPNIGHSNPKCAEATEILTSECGDDAQRMHVINNCQIVLHGVRQRQCVTTFSCDPMDVFNACVAWGCTNFSKEETDLCYAVADGIDMCPQMAHGGNLTARVDAANCYRDFIAIN